VNQSTLALLLPAATAVLGLFAGLTAPMIAQRVQAKERRAETQRGHCDEILRLFEDVDVRSTLLDTHSGTRRRMLLHAMRLTDKRARAACEELVEYATGPNGAQAELLDRWSTMIHEVARAYRESR
jgi:hypothetical protein